MEFFDTQLLVHASEGRTSLESSDPWISSVVAQEFLLFQKSGGESNDYYLPLVPKRDRGIWVSRALADYARSHPPAARLRSGKRRTDSIILEFGDTFPVTVEYSHRAIANALNARMVPFILAYAECVDAASRRVIKSRLRFLCDVGIKCKPLTDRSARLAQDLLRDFTERYTIKNNFRNTLNDIMILAIALDERARLLTDDRLLAIFSEDFLTDTVLGSENLYEIDLSEDVGKIDRRPPLESKGYINSRWRVRYGPV
ncbi:hypothetical protein [Actinoallomurus iriomotensis]|uniref:PIN domain-containing protein n=1 Tax=Actinoallomurus iriomotensis TaxID=478107 RepID=A0A9W6VTG2_9ACTN|nr:hypothetical protein [Actinoallomurus iriomotensis]GLY78487.1 hypothetical protein Airi01_067540 [Actinoallomurus iriomotensis]